MSDLITEAKLFASAAHGATGQVRHYIHQPYIVHPERVATIISQFTNNEYMIAAAWLHDVVEDTEISFSYLSQYFCPKVVMLVEGLTAFTDKNDFSHFDKTQKKVFNDQHLHNQSLEVQALKCADIRANIEFSVEQDERFAKKINIEKLTTLKRLDKVPFDDDFSGVFHDTLEIIKENISELQKVGWPMEDAMNSYIDLCNYLESFGSFSSE